MLDRVNSVAAHDAAVVDVGSNSVRLVIYRIEGRSIWTVYNEKVLAGLGRDLRSTGRLSPNGVTAALAAMRRFRAVLDAVRPAEIFTAATAAVRDAKDGAAFVERAKLETGLELRVLTGPEEARYAALGVLAGEPDGLGVVGDLGGASLELTHITADGPGEGVTLPLGPFAIVEKDQDQLRKAVDAQLIPIARRFSTPTFHAVGGAWRNLALLHMRLADYPLEVVHQYAMNRDEALDSCRFLGRQSRRSLEAVPGVSKKRLDTLPHAAVVLERLIENLGVERIVLSAYGLREGLLFEAMPLASRKLDPLVEGCAAMAALRGGDETLGPALETWLQPVFAALPPALGDRDAVMIAAASRLADLGARLHPDHRADLVFEQVLRAPIAGQIHTERAFLAVAAFARHTAAAAPPHDGVIGRLLTDGVRKRARALGAAIRLGCDLSGRNAGLLARTHLNLEGGKLVLRAARGFGDLLLGEQIQRRGASMAQHLGLKFEIRA